MWPFRNNKKQEQPKQSPPEDTRHIISVISPDDIASLGRLPNEAIAGFLVREPNAGEKLAPEHVRPNPVFIEFMHQVIRRSGPDDPQLQAAAKQQQAGWLYIIDLRTPEGPQGRVPPEDIIGAFQVQSGRVIPESYWANEKHQVYSEHGLVRLPSFFQEAFIRELRRSKQT
jgi:hypothetical protein